MGDWFWRGATAGGMSLIVRGTEDVGGDCQKERTEGENVYRVGVAADIGGT